LDGFTILDADSELLLPPPRMVNPSKA